jgi:hypothetical protein
MNERVVSHIEIFPLLANSNHRITSAKTPDYNCIAWAADDSDCWWWPTPKGVSYWPPGISRAVTIESFTRAFSTLGYEVCNDAILEEKYEKVAIYVNLDDVPTHMARQLSDGTWTSKLGQSNDINHNTLQVISGPTYGTATVYMRRLRK